MDNILEAPRWAWSCMYAQNRFNIWRREFKTELKIMSNLLTNIILLTVVSHLIPIYPSIIHPDVLCTFYVVDIDSLLYIMTLLDSSVVAVLCDCMLWVWLDVTSVSSCIIHWIPYIIRIMIYIVRYLSCSIVSSTDDDDDDDDDCTVHTGSLSLSSSFISTPFISYPPPDVDAWCILCVGDSDMDALMYIYLTDTYNCTWQWV